MWQTPRLTISRRFSTGRILPIEYYRKGCPSFGRPLFLSGGSLRPARFYEPQYSRNDYPKSSNCGDGFRLITGMRIRRARLTVYAVPPRGEPSYHATKNDELSTKKSLRRI